MSFQLPEPVMPQRPLVPLMFALGALAAGPAAGNGPGTATTQSEWTEVRPEGETGCAFGTPYRFFHRFVPDAPGLLVYFQGGGACWDWVSCSGLFDSTVRTDEPREFRGILERDDPRNPFRSWSVVFMPYCTGDVHVGSASRSYGEDGARVVAHRGYRNVSAVLDWLGARSIRPRTLVVAGTSAGAYGALFYMRPIATLFPDARVVLLGDSGVPLLSRNAEILAGWGADSVAASLWPGHAGVPTLLEAYRQAAQIGPRVRLAQITSDRDAVQSGFYLVSGSPGWREATYSLFDRVKTVTPAFRSFVVAGTDHGLLPVDAFYSYSAGGVDLVDWIGRLVSNDSISDVRCDECGGV